MDTLINHDHRVGGQRISGDDGLWNNVRTLDIKWGAVFGGWLVATAAAMLLYAVGSAIGIASINFADIENVGKKAALGATVWLLITWVISLYLGGLFSSAVTRETDKRTAGLQGIAVWALSSILTILVGVTGIGATGILGFQIAKGVGQVAGGGLAAVASSNTMQEGNEIPTAFQAQLKQAIAEQAAVRTAVSEDTLSQVADELNPETLSLIAAEFIRSDVEGAKNALALHTSLSGAEADKVVSGLSRQAEVLKAKAKETAERVADYTAAGLWCSIVISLFALGAAIFGGRSGARYYPVDGTLRYQKRESNIA